jgi:hypothetical protein
MTSPTEKKGLTLSEAVEAARGHADPVRDLGAMRGYKPIMIGSLNMDDLSDARAYFEKEYAAETTLFNGSKIAAGQYRRYADAVAQAAVMLSAQAALRADTADTEGRR